MKDCRKLVGFYTSEMGSIEKKLQLCKVTGDGESIFSIDYAELSAQTEAGNMTQFLRCLKSNQPDNIQVLLIPAGKTSPT
ncbi:hypothetical protein E2C01_060674 [Portunus trituberculatus]|uniref:Uncharacterized protein n=1 Tax=Portunus trituberculatus TaxID=210409 RepID=A0A5B7HA38_PORTR|nr:hypothetical protein [Portunus trituberculatus]